MSEPKCEHCGDLKEDCACIFCQNCDSVDDVDDNLICASCAKGDQEYQNTAANVGRHE